MFNFLQNIKFTFIILMIFTLTSCSQGFFKTGDARKNPPDPRERVRKNLEEGKGFRLMDSMTGNRGTNFEFASSNGLWRASLEILDFMPLTSADYGGGLIITDWYSDQNNSNESIKISIRFLSNEIRSDALKITVFSKECEKLINCKVSKSNPRIENELQVAILKRAAKYKKEMIESNPKRDLDSIITSQDRK